MARPFRRMLRRRRGGGTIAAVVPPPPRQSVAVCSTASVGCINHNVWRIYACYLYRAVFTLYRKKIIESSRGLLACELVSFAALLHKLYFIIFTAMLRFLSWLWRDHLYSYLNILGMIGSTYLADNVSFIDKHLQFIEQPDCICQFFPSHEYLKVCISKIS